MALKQQIDADIKKAMLAREKDVLRALRAIKAKLLLAETEKGAAEEVSDEAGMKILMKEAKQRKESADLYKEQGREDLAQVELDELKVISQYLPEQLSEEQIKAELQKIIDAVGAKGPQDMGKVMGQATKSMAGKADGKLIAATVKALLVN